MKSLLGLTLALILGALLHPRPQVLAYNGRIANGQDAQPKQFAYMVGIVVDMQGTFGLCGGALIGSDWILTAAHCVDSAPYVSVYLGATYTNHFKSSYKVWRSNTAIHPSWNRNTGQGDIALLKIPTTEPCDDVQPVRLPKMGAVHVTHVGEAGIVSGWGHLGHSGPMPDRLKWARMVVIREEACRSFVTDLPADQFCTDTSNNVFTCKGDSGGPLVLESSGELIGVVSGGSKQGCDFGPDLFTRVTNYLPWIKEITGISYQ